MAILRVADTLKGKQWKCGGDGGGVGKQQKCGGSIWARCGVDEGLMWGQCGRGTIKIKNKIKKGK